MVMITMEADRGTAEGMLMRHSDGNEPQVKATGGKANLVIKQQRTRLNCVHAGGLSGR